jgi:hypothetical protein
MINSKDLQYFDLARQGRQIMSQSELEAFDRHFFQLLQAEDRGYWEGWLAYNEFRIANIHRLPKTRPHILVGGPINVIYPHYHIKPLYALADVVALTNSTVNYNYASVVTCERATVFLDILKRLPEGFKPDFYWDNQVEHLHYIPPGLDQAPFPIVASVCHTFLHKSVLAICELFDYVITGSKFYSKLLRTRFGDKILDIPFGLNWGAFEYILKPNWNKSIDVFLSFEESSNPIYDNKRNRVIRAFTKFKEKYGDRYSLLLVNKLSKKDYLQILSQSRIAINVTGVNGPYNYRTAETMCAGTLLLEYEWEKDFFEISFSELFIDGVHGVSFTENTFEAKLLYYLEHRNEAESIAKAGYQYIAEKYSYKKLFNTLIDIIHKKSPLKYPRTASLELGFFHNDMIFYYQGNKTVFSSMGYGLLNLRNQPAWIRYNNLLVYSSFMSQEHPHYNLFMVQMMEVMPCTSIPTPKSLLSDLYLLAKQETPPEFLWILEWNYFLVRIELEKPSKQIILDVLQKLNETHPTPFDENQILFKYYVFYENYAKYTVQATDHLPLDYMTLNIDLLKARDDAQARAVLYRDYAIKMVKNLLEEIYAVPNSSPAHRPVVHQNPLL